MPRRPHALIYGKVDTFRIRNDSMSIRLLVFGRDGYTRYIWVFCNIFRNIRKGEYLKIRGTFDGDILAPVFWYHSWLVGTTSDIEIFSISEQTAKKSYCAFTLDCTFSNTGYYNDYYYYHVGYFAPHTDDDGDERRFRSFEFILRGKAANGYYDYETGDRAWLRFLGEFAPGDKFLVSEID